MENIETTWFGGIRQRYNFLLFLVVACIPWVLWELLMAMAFFGGTLFDDPNEMGMSLLMAFVFPLIAAPLISGLALLIAKLLSIRGLRYLVVIGLGGVVPLGALALVGVGHLITRKLYTGA